LRTDDTVNIVFATEEFDRLLKDSIIPKYSNGIVKGDLGNGTIRYEGVHASDVPQATLWRIQIFGGVLLSSVDVKAGTSSVVVAMTGPLVPPDLHVVSL
jgi:hypothetical protein